MVTETVNRQSTFFVCVCVPQAKSSFDIKLFVLEKAIEDAGKLLEIVG